MVVSLELDPELTGRMAGLRDRALKMNVRV